MGKLERLTEDSKAYLHYSEQIHCVILGAFEKVSQMTGIYRVRSGIVLATNRRVVFFRRRFLHIEVTDSVSLSDISSIEMREAHSNLSQLPNLDQTITIRASDNKFRMEIEDITEGDVKKFVDYVRDNSGDAYTVSTPERADDVPDRSEIHFNVSQWLRDMGLDLYETNFVDNDINGREILLMLAEHDLEKIGVGSRGHRKQMLASMDELRREISEHPEERFDENKQTNAPAVQGPATEKQETYSGCVGFLTFCIPGVGQMIIGQGAKGAGMLIGAIALGTVSFGLLSIPFMFWSYIDYKASVAHKIK